MNNPFSFRHFLNSVPLWILAIVLLPIMPSRADDQPPERRMENRFLFVIDTSSAMKSRKQGVAEAVNGLLESGMRGELRKGDTIGLWTYSDRLDADFPMEVWSDDKKKSILSEVREHVDHLRYEKHAHLEKAMPSIKDVVANSERLTIILIFDGSELIKGTSFDKDINDLHKRYAREFRNASEPFVTVLAARKGLFFDYTINYPSTVIVPHTADPLPPPETNAPPALAVTEPPPPVEPETPKTHIPIVLSGPDFARKASAPAPSITNTPTATVPAPAPPVATTNVALPPEAAPLAAGQTAPTNVAALEPQPPTASPSSITPVATSTPPAPSNPPIATVPAPSSSAPSLTKPAKPAVVESAPSTMAVMTNTAAPAAAPKATAPANSALVAATTGELTAMFVIAFSLLTIAVVLVLLLVRRWRGGPQPSLISQSIDRSR
jgi:von Willebrand factor type A domain